MKPTLLLSLALTLAATPALADKPTPLKSLAYCQSVSGLKTIQAADADMLDVTTKDKAMKAKASAFRAKCLAYQSNPTQTGPALDDFNKSKDDMTASYAAFHTSVAKLKTDSAAAYQNLGAGTSEGDCEGFFKNVGRILDKMESQYTVQTLCGPAAPSLQDLVNH